MTSTRQRTTTLDAIPLGAACSVTLHRTLRIPDDGSDYPLPPSLGALPVYPVGEDEFVVPMRSAEALWLALEGPHWKPRALKVGLGTTDALSGEAFDADRLTRRSQDYLVIPDQPWLDGINAGNGFIRQFVAAPLGEGLTVEAQLSDAPEEGGLVFSLFDPFPGRFPDEPPAWVSKALICECSDALGLGAGGRMRQEIFEDEHGADTWQDEPSVGARVELVNALAFEAVTGIKAPAPVIDAETYTRFGLPWFDLISPTRKDIEASERLAGVRSIDDLKQLPAGELLPISEAQVVRLLQVKDLFA